jgi:anti-sigma B factor antagonist
LAITGSHRRQARAMNAPPVPGGLAIRRREDGTRLVLALRGELDLGSTPKLERELSAPLSGEYRQITVDLTQLDFIDSRGLVALVRAQKAAESCQKAFLLRRGGRQVQRLFDVTGYGALFTFEE